MELIEIAIVTRGSDDQRSFGSVAKKGATGGEGVMQAFQSEYTFA